MNALVTRFILKKTEIRPHIRVLRPVMTENDVVYAHETRKWPNIVV
jgi:hypothetical protein